MNKLKKIKSSILTLLFGCFIATMPMLISSAEASMPMLISPTTTSPGSNLAQKPPMGWNTFQCSVMEEEDIKEVIDYIATYMKSVGYVYIMLDGGWSTGHDAYGRGLVNSKKFPSGIKSMTDYAHSKGLKLGLWLIRGIPRSAYNENCQIMGTNYYARDIADTSSTCAWSKSSYGLNMSRPGAQAYLNSVFSMYAEWGIDFVKVDDLCMPFHKEEIEGYNIARNNCGRPMVLSGSPGDTALTANAPTYMNNLEMWRITRDKWDNTEDLEHLFDVIPDWIPYCKPGSWPDADIMPFGYIRSMNTQGKTTSMTALSQNQVRSWMTLNCISRSPLFMGGDVRKNDAFTLNTLTNPEVIAVNQNGSDPQQLLNKSGVVSKWVSNTENGGKYVALFNRSAHSATISFTLSEIGLSETCIVRDLWDKKDLGKYTKNFSVTLEGQACGLYKVMPPSSSL